MSDLSKELVAELLLDNVTDELVSCYIKLSGILTDSGFDSHTTQLEDLYSAVNARNVDILAIPTEVENILLNALDIVLSQCGIKLNPDLGIDLRIAIAEGILLFDITEEVDVIYVKLENSVDDTEALCKVLEFTLGIDINELFPAFEKVEPMIISRMRDLIVSGIEVAPAVFKDPAEVTASDILTARYNKLKVLKLGTIGGDLAASVEPTPLSFESLYAYNAHIVMKKPMSEAIDDLYSLSVLGNLSVEEATVQIGLCLDDLYPDVVDRGKAERLSVKIREDYTDLYIGDSNEEV